MTSNFAFPLYHSTFQLFELIIFCNLITFCLYELHSHIVQGKVIYNILVVFTAIFPLRNLHGMVH